MDLTHVLAAIPNTTYGTETLPLNHPLAQARLDDGSLTETLMQRYAERGTRSQVKSLLEADSLTPGALDTIIERLAEEPSWDTIAKKAAGIVTASQQAHRLVDAWAEADDLWRLLDVDDTVRIPLGKKLIDAGGDDLTFPIVLHDGHPEIYDPLAQHLLTLPNWWENTYLETILKSPWTRDATKARIIREAPNSNRAHLAAIVFDKKHSTIGPLLKKELEGVPGVEMLFATSPVVQVWAEQILDAPPEDLMNVLEGAPSEAHPLFAARRDAPHAVLLDPRVLVHLNGSFRDWRLGGRNSPELLEWIFTEVPGEGSSLTRCRRHLKSLKGEEALKFAKDVFPLLAADEAEVFLDSALGYGLPLTIIFEVPWKALSGFFSSNSEDPAAERLLTEYFTSNFSSAAHYETLATLQERFAGTVRDLVSAVLDIHR